MLSLNAPPHRELRAQPRNLAGGPGRGGMRDGG
jgi:hypothetical protein